MVSRRQFSKDTDSDSVIDTDINKSEIEKTSMGDSFDTGKYAHLRESQLDEFTVQRVFTAGHRRVTSADIGYVVNELALWLSRSAPTCTCCRGRTMAR